MRPLKASLKVWTGLGFVATIDGGEGGFSRIRNIAGKQKHIVIIDIIDINRLKRALVS
jgi:Ni,Fe-hydrogenase maturation factor